jgi:organic hydroperoxide reductase OsmC/OhrA
VPALRPPRRPIEALNAAQSFMKGVKKSNLKTGQLTPEELLAAHAGCFMGCD